MATMNNRPDYWLGLALNRDANDGAFAPWWLDWTAKFRKVTGLVRGRNFELDRAMSSDPSLFLRDPDETLNPENTSSPYAGMVLPYREACLLQQWPNQPAGGAVNLFNTGTWRGNKEDARDGSFESFAVGATPSWVTPRRASVGASVTSGAAFQGSQKLSWTTSTSGSGVPQGVQWPIPCIPGRQYTVSAYLSQDTASTYGLDVAGVTTCTDPFMPRTVSNGWGTPTFAGPAYTTSGGAAADYSVSGGYGIQAHPAVNTLHTCLTDTASPDHAVTARAVLPVVPTGDSVTLWAVARWTDANNYYVGRLDIRPGGMPTMGIYKRVGGVLSSLVTLAAFNQTLPVHYAGDEWNVSLSVDGYALTATAWKTTAPRVVATLTQVDFSLTTGNLAGFGSRLEASNTNTLPVQVKVGDFQAVATVRGSTTSTTGAGYTRLSCTFTATQPSHQVYVVTRSGTGVAGAVRLDAIQHEQGAAPSTYTISGPVIYPGVRHNIEQWPREYEAAGFLGVTDPPGVDAFASLNAISLRTEYQQAVLNLGPDYFYPLSDGTQTLLFSDQSGQGRTPLAPLVSKTGAGPGIAAGTSITIPGDPGATGVKFTYNPPVSSAQQGIILGNLTPVALPPVTAMPYWECTIAGWFQVPTGDPNGQVLVTFNNGLPGTAAYMGANVIVNQGGSGALNANLLSGFSLGPISVSGTPMDNAPHWFLFSFSVDNGTNTVNQSLWLDGSQAVAGWSFGYAGNPATLLRIGGNFDYGGVSSACNGVISDVAIWNRMLTDAEAAALYAAGRTAFAGETSGTRSARHLASGGFSGATRITTAGPATTMQPPSWTGQVDLLSDIQGSTEAEQGATWVAPDGAVVIETRNDRWLRLTPSVTFGENYAGGEVPYLMDGLRFVPDPLYVYANVTVERINGTAAVGGTIQDVSTARRRFFPRAVQLSADFQTDALAQSCANWIFNTHSAPVTRVDALIIEPFANPALWPIALSLEPGKRVQFVRRAKAGNGGAGFTFTRDFFVEKIDIPEINFATGVYQIRVQLSPINAGGAPSFQPWILNDTTYSVLNSTTILGW